MLKAIVSWSGGKDGCLACYKAIEAGCQVVYLFNTISAEHGRVCFHGIEAALIQRQAEALGIPLLQRATTDGGYEREFKETVGGVIPEGIEALVFGDIYFEPHKEWTDRVSAELGLEGISPLWGYSPEEVFLEFLAAGFEAIVVSARADLMGEEWLGRKLDEDFLADLKRLEGVDVCGENGEYHTLVVDGPMFKRRLAIGAMRKVLREGRWLLDIREGDGSERAG